MDGCGWLGVPIPLATCFPRLVLPPVAVIRYVKKKNVLFRSHYDFLPERAPFFLDHTNFKISPVLTTAERAQTYETELLRVPT